MVTKSVPNNTQGLRKIWAGPVVLAQNTKMITSSPSRSSSALGVRASIQESVLNGLIAFSAVQPTRYKRDMCRIVVICHEIDI